MMEIKIIKQEQDGSTLSSITDVKSLVAFNATFLDLAADVILISKLHTKYTSEIDNVRRQLFLVAMQAKQ